jgi:O-antigen ligase
LPGAARRQYGELMARHVWLASVIMLLSWGTFAFGSPYPWAYQPLLAGSVAVGAFGWWVGRHRRGSPMAFVVALAAFAVAVLIQLIPLPLDTLNAISPHARTILIEQNLLVAAGMVTTHPLSIAPSRTWLGLGFFAAFALLLLGTVRVLTRPTASRLAASIAILGATLAIVAIIQQATFTGKIYGFWELVQGGTPFGPFVNKNHFAGWMLMAIPVALGYFLSRLASAESSRQSDVRSAILWFSTPQASRLVLSGFAVVLMSLSLVLTLSRSGVAGLLIAFAVTAMFIARSDDRSPRRKVAFIYLALSAAAIFVWAGLDQVVLRFSQLDVSGIDQRPAIWGDTMRIVRDFWVTGTGLNTFGVSTMHYQASVPGEHLREAHNDYLQIAAEGGSLLVIPAVAAILVYGGAVRRRLREDVGSIRWVRIGAVTGLIAIAFQSMVEFSLQMPGNAALFAVIAGLAIHDGHRV